MGSTSELCVCVCVTSHKKKHIHLLLKVHLLVPLLCMYM